MAFEQRVIKISPSVYDKVTAVKLAMESERQRQVTYSETVEYLVTHWETLATLTGQEAVR